MNIADLFLIALLVIVLFFAVRRIIKTRKTGGCGCGCSCSGECACCGSNTGRSKS